MSEIWPSLITLPISLHDRLIFYLKIKFWVAKNCLWYLENLIKLWKDNGASSWTMVTSAIALLVSFERFKKDYRDTWTDIFKGLNMSSGYSCFDINECDEFDTGQTNICPKYSECINVYASYQCACYDGFVAYNGSCQVCSDYISKMISSVNLGRRWMWWWRFLSRKFKMY